MDNWNEGKEEFKLDDVYSLKKADTEKFAIFESIYGDKIYNRFAVKDFNLRLSITTDVPFSEYNKFFWIQKKNKTIGGILLEPNIISRFFTIPPFENTFEILKLLKKALLLWSKKEKKIYAYQFKNKESNYLRMLGFWPSKTRKWMIRPTEKFDLTFNNQFLLKTPVDQDKQTIAKLFLKSFQNNIDSMYSTFENHSITRYEDYFKGVKNYFDNTQEEIMLKASSVIYDKETKKLIGACLISKFEKWPLIHTIAVDQDYRGNQLATQMINHALTVLADDYDVLRLFVTEGNLAEAIYYQLGFVSGLTFNKLFLPE